MFIAREVLPYIMRKKDFSMVKSKMETGQADKIIELGYFLSAIARVI